MSGLAHDLKALEEYEMASRAQAEMKMVGAARQMEAAFSGLGGDDDRDQDDEGERGGENHHHQSNQSRGGGGGGEGATPRNNEWEIVGDGGGAGSSGVVGDDWSSRKGGAEARGVAEAGKPHSNNDDPNDDPNSFGAATHGMNTGRSADESIRKCLAEGQEARETNRGLGIPVIRRGYLSQRADGGKWGGGGGGRWTRRYFVVGGLYKLNAVNP
jgi:hypothetical protein